MALTMKHMAGVFRPSNLNYLETITYIDLRFELTPPIWLVLWFYMV